MIYLLADLFITILFLSAGYVLKRSINDLKETLSDIENRLKKNESEINDLYISSDDRLSFQEKIQSLESKQKALQQDNNQLNEFVDRSLKKINARYNRIKDVEEEEELKRQLEASLNQNDLFRSRNQAGENMKKIIKR